MAVSARIAKGPCVLVQTVTCPSGAHHAVDVWGSM